MVLRFAAPILLASAAMAQDAPKPEQILLVQEHDAMVRRVQSREVAPPKPTAAASTDPRSPQQKAEDKALLDAYFKLKPTGRLIPVSFPDGTVLYVPEVRGERGECSGVTK
jgi:hypothetical protein